MIDKVLTRSFVVAHMHEVGRAHGATVQPEASAALTAGTDLPPELSAPLTAQELEEARVLMAAAANREQEQPDSPPQPLDDGTDGPPLEERAFMAGDADTSLAQAVMETYLHEHEHEAIAPAPVGPDTDGTLPEPVATHRLHIGSAKGEATESDSLKFVPIDPGWALTAFAMGRRKVRHRHPFAPTPAPPVTLADDARVLVVGDWASGTPRAQAVSAQMRHWLDEGIAQGRSQHVVHLGDTYYAGLTSEYEKNFLPYWPVRPGEAIGSWSLNGNHDMYAGGYGYFDCLLADSRFAAQQRSSWFSLANDHWQLLALDTSWDDAQLTGDQAAWVAQQRKDHPVRRTMLLSHHPLFDHPADEGSRIEEALRAAGALDQPLDAWIWGHQHACVAYHEDPRVRHARLIGHGGLPVLAHEPQGLDRIAWHEDDYVRGGPLRLEKWGLMGFAVLDFAETVITVQYVDERGRVRWTEQIT